MGYRHLSIGCFVNSTIQRRSRCLAAFTLSTVTGNIMLQVWPVLLLMVIVFGGLFSGFFTATEAGGIAVVYSLILAVLVYREVKPSDIAEILIKSAETTAIVMFLIGTSIAMSWLLAYENVPGQLAGILLQISDNPFTSRREKQRVEQPQQSTAEYQHHENQREINRKF